MTIPHCRLIEPPNAFANSNFKKYCKLEDDEKDPVQKSLVAEFCKKHEPKLIELIERIFCLACSYAEDKNSETYKKCEEKAQEIYQLFNNTMHEAVEPLVCDSSSSKKSGKRAKFSASIRQVLQDWYEEHQDDPFPTEAEKKLLSEETGLSAFQVEDWYVNKRSRHARALKSKSKNRKRK